ncbi:hypothetical protein PO909_014394 [Leuciscus waleckii]
MLPGHLLEVTGLIIGYSSVCLPVYLTCFHIVSVCGEIEVIETVKVKEGGFLNLHPGLHDLNGDVQILWTFESGRQSTRVAQMHQGKIYSQYDKRLTGRVQLDRDTGILTISGIRTNESGLYKAVIIVNKKVTLQKYEVEVYAPVTVPAIISSSAVTVHTSTGVTVHTSTGVTVHTSTGVTVHTSTGVTVHTSTGVTVHTSTGVTVHTSTVSPEYPDSVGSCGGEAEVLVRLVLSGLVGIATVVFLVDHIRCCTSRRGDRSSV